MSYYLQLHSELLFLNYIVCVCVEYRSEDNLWKLFFSSYYVGPMEHPHVVRLWDKGLNLLSHFVYPEILVLMNILIHEYL